VVAFIKDMLLLVLYGRSMIAKDKGIPDLPPSTLLLCGLVRSSTLYSEFTAASESNVFGFGCKKDEVEERGILSSQHVARRRHARWRTAEK
jgi:hypothetical protein